MSWTQRVKHPSNLVSVGALIEAQVLSVDPAGKRISLGMKQVEANPWHTLAGRYPVGSTIEGKVRTITDFGAFVSVEEGIDGLIHISDLSWTRHVKHPSNMLKKGQATKAVVLSIDPHKERISLGLKQLTPDPWDKAIPERYKVGQDEKIKVDRGDRKVALSIKAHERGRDKDALKEYMRQQEKPDTTLGALLKERS